MKECYAVLCLSAFAILVGMTGCAGASKEAFGRTYYIDGAGNWGFGVANVMDGLAAAGYRGSVRNWRWSVTFNPLLDQTVGRGHARIRGANLGQEITEYKRRYPGNQVNIIALSAGTGVAVWACEALTPPGKVHNVILLSSNLSSRYDMHKAMRDIDGKVFVYASPHDEILDGPMRALGTIDGTFDEPAGVAGFRTPADLRDRIVNIRWSAKYERHGWTGSHTDCTSEPFVRVVLSQHIIERPD